ncbi:type II toxin-antitoxin system VapC family toxin [Modestobacter sp. Leaf380]|uniref:type II toxin-antitoxin system VapC family toxin n=1 Tax=Modestobacter sp. Leaf380 TaxID=1736356 RepID=UPI0009E908A5
MIVLDASAGLAALLRSGPARAAVASEQVHVPHLADVEVVHTLRRLLLSGQLEGPQAEAAVRTWSRLGLVRHSVHPLLGRVWELRDSVTAYDASYVALAESLGCPLVTADRRLARAGAARCPVTVVPN